VIPEIGILVGLYVITRIIPASWRTAVRIASVVTVVAATFVILDLFLQGATEKSLLSFLKGTSADEVSTAASKSGGEKRGSEKKLVTVTRAEGGSITTNLGYGIALAKNSALKREWIAVHDTSLPVDLEGTPGVVTAFVPGGYSGEYRYRSNFSVVTRSPVQAIEVRFLTFDVWGDHTQTLSYEEVLDIPGNAKREFKGEWRIFAENDAERHYASIAYVARLRLADGRVLLASEAPVLAEAKKFSEKFTAADLEPEPKREGKKGPVSNPGPQADG
jgi:hypothetical protein